jgi:hypothetical protein
MIAVYPVGVPLLFFLLLRRYQPHMHERHVSLALGFLVEAYRSELYGFEFVDLGVKLLLTSVLGFLPIDAQMPLAMCLVFGYGMLILLFNPFIRGEDDALTLLAQAELFALFLGSYTVRAVAQSSDGGDSVYDTQTDALLSALSIALVVLVFVAFAARLLLYARQYLRDRQRLKVVRQQARQSAFAKSTPTETAADAAEGMHAHALFSQPHAAALRYDAGRTSPIPGEAPVRRVSDVDVPNPLADSTLAHGGDPAFLAATRHSAATAHGGGEARLPGRAGSTSGVQIEMTDTSGTAL